jgi:sugar (pentulose or hexulose) kinase
LYQAILNEETHINQIDFITTLAGYVHYKLTGKNVLGTGDATGVFPVDSINGEYDAKMVATFDSLVAGKNFGWQIKDILPTILNAGEIAGELTAEGAKLLDPTGTLNAGVKFCPPEGDAGTGMVATNSVAARTGNVSAGTSIFAMVVLERPLSKLYTEIDMVTTPDGKPVAMVHCNNGTSDINGWAQMFKEIVSLYSPITDISDGELYEKLYKAALNGEADGGGLVACSYLSGEHNTGFEEGRPLFARKPDANFTLANFMRTLLYSVMATLKIGMEILDNENVKLEQLLGHGGLFLTEGVAQKLMAGALNVPVSVMETAGEGGAWGIALLAAYTASGKEDGTLDEFLNKRVFAKLAAKKVTPVAEDINGFNAYMERYKAGLLIERTAVDNLK